MGANAQIAVPAFTAGQILTAAQQTQINTGIPVFSGTATRDAAFGGSGEKVLAEGQFAFLEDTNTTQYYDGAAWQPVGVTPGMVLVKTQTIGSAVSSVTVTDAFSATYENYLVTISGGVGSAAVEAIRFRIGTAATNYYGGFTGTTPAGAVAAVGANNTTSASIAGYSTTSNLFMNGFINGPFLAKTSYMFFGGVRDGAGGFGSSFYEHFDATSYSSFSFFPASGTLTGGTVRVYGYANS
jgi:hypothetical protein